jgi:hypothetical protein
MIQSSYYAIISPRNSPSAFRISNGSLPDGLSIDNNGVISGNPTSIGTSSFSIIASNLAGDSAPINYSITISESMVSDGPIVNVEMITACKGEIGVRVPIRITNNTGIGDAFIKFEFPDDLILSAFDGTGGMSVDIANSLVASKAVWLQDSDETTGYTGSLLVTLVFDISSEATEGLKEIKVIAAESSYSTPMARSVFVGYLSGGGITVTNIMIGDCNGDGKIDAADVTYLKRSIAGRPGFEKNNAMDCNKDGKIDAADVTYLKRAIAKRPGFDL